MPIDLSTIPAERLALLDTATLFFGSHSGGGPDCQHCARELLMEVVTGRHEDATPPGCTTLMAILPKVNDGPWRDNAHRTEVLRPYLRKMLLLDPADDERRIYAVIDLVYRKTLPDICDALDEHGSALRDLAPIVDRKSARDARDALAARDARDARDALDALDALAVFDALAVLDALDARAARDARDALAVLDALDARDARDALDALDALAVFDPLAVLDALAESWERGVRDILDRICGA